MANEIPESWYHGGGAVPVEVVTYRCATCRRTLTKLPASGIFVHQPTLDDRTARFREDDRAAAIKRKASLPEYPGGTPGAAITLCQATVSSDQGRWVQYGRCTHKAKYVRAVAPAVSVPAGAGSNVSDVIAVCGVHARVSGAFRYSGTDYPKGRGAATERVEDEYLPAGFSWPALPEGTQHAVGDSTGMKPNSVRAWVDGVER